MVIGSYRLTTQANFLGKLVPGWLVIGWVGWLMARVTWGVLRGRCVGDPLLETCLSRAFCYYI